MGPGAQDRCRSSGSCGRVKVVQRPTSSRSVDHLLRALGELPFAAPTLPGVLYKVCHLAPSPLSQIVPVRPGVDAVLARAMAKRKADGTSAWRTSCAPSAASSCRRSCGRARAAASEPAVASQEGARMGRRPRSRPRSRCPGVPGGRPRRGPTPASPRRRRAGHRKDRFAAARARIPAGRPRRRRSGRGRRAGRIRSRSRGPR